MWSSGTLSIFTLLCTITTVHLQSYFIFPLYGFESNTLHFMAYHPSLRGMLISEVFIRGRVYFWEFTKYSPWLYLVYFWMFCCIPLVCFFVCRCHIVLFIEDLDYLLIYNRASFLSLVFFCCSSEDVFLQLFLCICPDKRGSFSLAVVDLLSFLLSTYSPLKL